ncbi:MAG TPA: phenylalanine--tRNA ligase subunit alpha [bacterium]
MSSLLTETLEALSSLREQFENQVREATTAERLEELRIKYLGRKGEIANYFSQMGSLAAEERPRLGQALNALKDHVQDAIASIERNLQSQKVDDGYIDLTLPGTYQQEIGYTNPLIQILEEVKEIFTGMGFSIETGPEVESEYYNFEALNVPADHPARDLQDTFYLPNGLVLRTHTSPVQVRTMEKRQPPIRVIAPGRCFRKDTPDATHSPIFHQVEGLVVDKGISFAHMKGTLLSFGRKLLGEKLRVRFRPSFYPFTEPSADYDFSCVFCDGKGCRICKNSGWIEISGCGMVHPAVFGYVNYDYETYTGFAWGMGVERIAMMKYQVDDIRHFYENDMRFLMQF